MMKPTAPKRIVWILGLLLGLLGIIGNFANLDFLTTNSFWFLLAGFALLAIGTSFKGV